jgi:hypothetical protein
MMIFVSYACQSLGCAAIVFSIFGGADDLFESGMLLVILSVVIRIEVKQ